MIAYYKNKFRWAWDQFWGSQSDAKFAESSDDWSQLQIKAASNPFDSPDVTLVYEDEL